MNEQAMLRERLRKVEALFARPGHEGERLAAEAAMKRIRERLAELRRQEPFHDRPFAMNDQWPRDLLAVFERHGQAAYGLCRESVATAMERAPAFVLDVLWPKFEDLARFWRGGG